MFRRNIIAVAVIALVLVAVAVLGFGQDSQGRQGAVSISDEGSIVDPAGNIVTVSVNGQGTGSQILLTKTSTKTGVKLIDSLVVISSPGNVSLPSLRVNNQGYIYLFYLDDRNKDKGFSELYAARLGDNYSVVGEEVRISQAGATGRVTSYDATSDMQNVIHITYIQKVNSGNDVMYATLNTDGFLSEPRNVRISNTGEVSHPRILILSNGVAMLYTVNRENNLLVGWSQIDGNGNVTAREIPADNSLVVGSTLLLQDTHESRGQNGQSRPTSQDITPSTGAHTSLSNNSSQVAENSSEEEERDDLSRDSDREDEHKEKIRKIKANLILGGDLLPDVTGLRNIGRSDRVWNNMYLQNLIMPKGVITGVEEIISGSPLVIRSRAPFFSSSSERIVFQTGPTPPGPINRMAIDPFGGVVIGPITNAQNAISRLQVMGDIAITTGGGIRIYNSGTNFVGFNAPLSIPLSTVWTLPPADGLVGQVLQTNGGGTLLWQYINTASITDGAVTTAKITNGAVTSTQLASTSVYQNLGITSAQATAIASAIYANNGTNRFATISDIPPAGITACGTATTNFVTKFISPSTICNSQIYDNGINVGIGTATPTSSAFLHIKAGAPPAAGDIIIERASDTVAPLDATSPRVGLVDTAVTGDVTTSPAWYVDNTKDRFRIFRQPNITTAGVAYLTVSNNGHVGVGTGFDVISPAEWLEVNGNLKLDNRLPDGSRLIWRGVVNGVPKDYRARVFSDGRLGFFPVEAGNPGFVGEPLILTQSGQVGIGSILPTANESLSVNGNFVVHNGLKSADVQTSNHGWRRLYAREGASVRFVDEGKGKLVNGVARIDLDPIFMETIEGEYLVHLTCEGESKGIYVDEKGANYFVLRENGGGTSNVSFAYMLTATRKGYAGVRLQQVEEARRP